MNSQALRLHCLLIAAICAAIVAVPASVSEASTAKTKQIDVAYLPPNDPVHQPLYELLKEKRILEKVQELLSPFRLPRRLLMKVESCDGSANAWYNEGVITVCYEYLDEIWQNVPKETTPAGITPIDALVGPMLDVFLHEFGHALFHLLRVPVLGREEDAADQFAAYMMLQFGKEEARRLIAGTAYVFKNELKDPQVTLELKRFSVAHGTPAQRFYNLLCIAYGADATLFADLVKKGYLPEERAWGCEDEYRQVAHAFRTLIAPHVDATPVRKVLARKWLPDAKARPPPRPPSAQPR